MYHVQISYQLSARFELFVSYFHLCLSVRLFPYVFLYVYLLSFRLSVHYIFISTFVHPFDYFPLYMVLNRTDDGLSTLAFVSVSTYHLLSFGLSVNMSVYLFPSHWLSVYLFDILSIFCICLFMYVCPLFCLSILFKWAGCWRYVCIGARVHKENSFQLQVILRQNRQIHEQTLMAKHGRNQGTHIEGEGSVRRTFLY